MMNKDKILEYALLVFAAFPLIPNSIKGIPVVVLLIIAIFCGNFKKIQWKWLLINSSLFLVYLISLLNTQDFGIAMKKLETGLSILIIPVIFYIFLSQFNFKSTFKVKFYKLFIFSTFVFTVISFLFIFSNDSSEYYTHWYLDKFRSLIVEVPVIGQHPIYASMFLALSLLFFIEKNKVLSIKVTFKSPFLYFVLANMTLLVMLMSKGVIIALIIVAIFMNLKRSKVVIILILILLPLLTLNNRVKELFNVEMYTSINENFSTSIRTGVYKCAYEVIKNEWIWGYGIGDSQRVLNFCYSYESNVLLKNRFNSHNQYLDVFIKTGVFGFVIFICFLLMNFKKARENQNRLATFVLGFFCILFLTENILSRQSGVILFFFLLSFLNQESLEIKLKKNEVSKSKPL